MEQFEESMIEGLLETMDSIITQGESYLAAFKAVDREFLSDELQLDNTLGSSIRMSPLLTGQSLKSIENESLHFYFAFQGNIVLVSISLRYRMLLYHQRGNRPCLLL